ncbi:MAG: HesA/MoeB/ThiF family protein [Leptospirales bacterium]|jgi:molybdopterin/thiamine biosynthesis adenylyltransferase
MLTRDELSRYSRNIFLEQIGREGQERLKAARVFVIGAGGLGSPVLMYLAAAGVGHLACIDGDHLELTNLQRQVLYSTAEVGQAKATAAAARIRALNPEIEIQPIVGRFTAANAAGYLRGYDLLIETSDNFPTKFLANDVAILAGIPLIMGGILRFEGQVLAVRPGRSACYRCIFERPPPPDAVPNCAQAGVLGAIAGIVGSMQAAEALKLLTGAGLDPAGHLMMLDLLDTNLRRIPVARNPDCPVCGPRAEIFSIEQKNYDETAG